MPYTPPPFHELTPAQKRQLIAGYADVPVRVTMRDRIEHTIIPQGIAQEERKEANQFSSKGNLIVARFYATPSLLVLRLSDVYTIERLELNVTDPRHPDYVPEQQIMTPIPVEALAARKRRAPNQHDQL